MAAVPPRTPEPALATTKRKFDTLLDRLTASASTTSLANTLRDPAAAASISHSETPEPATKRSRGSKGSMDGQRVVSSNERIQALKDQLFTLRNDGDRPAAVALRIVGEDRSSTTAGAPRQPTNYQPYSQDAFLARLKTFADVKKWTNKPDTISEVEWAKRGWSCDTWNTVACKGGCEQRVAVKLRPSRRRANGEEIDMSEDMGAELEEGLVDKYWHLVVEGHHEDCLWRKRGCQGDIYHIPLPSRAKSSAELLNRYRALKALGDDLPLLENIIYPEPHVEDILLRIPLSFWQFTDSGLAEDPPSTSVEIVALLFAIFGWTGVSESKIALAMCHHCFQRNGLWLCADSRLKEMSKKLDVPIETLRLNLVESHREHCPWKNAETQRNPPDGPIADMAGWQTQQFMLLGRKRERQRTNIESVDLGSEYTYPRGSEDSDMRSPLKEDRDDTMHEKWRRFKAKLRRTTSRKSLKSSKSVKSGKSGKSEKSVNEKENKQATD